MRGRLTYGAAGIAIIVVAIVYWPVIHANFVYSDWLDFHQQSWLRHGDEWKHYIFRDFNTWTNYFRPLGVALLTLQVRLFDLAPGPMHAVSLGIHLINTLLVGLLSWRCRDTAMNERHRTWLPAAVMLLYGLHPVLIEPVAWISCQFDLIVTMFMLSGVLANTCIRGTTTRAVAVATLFFLAACTKESAVSLPLILVVFDWLLFCRRRGEDILSSISTLIRRNWQVYVAMFFAGIVYLGFRHWAIGKIINPFSGSSSSLLERLQEVCFIYLHYWRILIWPMSGMSPIHPLDTTQFNIVSIPSALTDLAAIGIVVAGFYLALRRASTAGCIVVAVTAALLPVLHIASVEFDNSLYHERYAMPALAVTCVMLSRLSLRGPTFNRLQRFGDPLLATVFLFWLAFAIIDIRVTLPLWADNIHLWRWALTEYPDSITAKNNLLSAYIDISDHADAHKLIDRLQEDHVPCSLCMLNAAILAVSENDPARATTALEVVRNSRELLTDKLMLHSYLLTTGRMLVLQGNWDEAENILRATVKMDPLDPQPRLSLAAALAYHGKKEEALEMGKSGLALLPPDERDSAQSVLDRALAAGVEPTRRVHQYPTTK